MSGAEDESCALDLRFKLSSQPSSSPSTMDVLVLWSSDSPGLNQERMRSHLGVLEQNERVQSDSDMPKNSERLKLEASIPKNSQRVQSDFGGSGQSEGMDIVLLVHTAGSLHWHIMQQFATLQNEYVEGVPIHYLHHLTIGTSNG